MELTFCLGLFGGRETFDFISIFLSCLHGGKTCILMCGLKCSLGVVWILRLGLGCILVVIAKEELGASPLQSWFIDLQLSNGLYLFCKLWLL